MNSIFCPYCHRFTELSNRGAFDSIKGMFWMGECNACHEVVLVNSSKNQMYPTPLPYPVDEKIKEHIRNDFKESILCFSVGAYRAAAVIARRALQNVCLDKGANENDKLEKQIDWLFNQQIITRDLKDWAHEVRIVGNDAAHPKKSDQENLVNKEDSDDIIKLLEQFCQVLYVAPAIASERKKLRQN